MKLFDLHCDTLTKCMDESLRIQDSDSCQLNFNRGAGFSHWAQCFAVFVPDTMRGQPALEYYRRAVRYFLDTTDITFAEDLHKDLPKYEKTGGLLPILTVEGGAVLAGASENLWELSRDGVKLLTLTWNGENELGFGADENGPLKPFGKQAVKDMAECGIIPDVSHLSERGFYDVFDVCNGPVVASHSNSNEICAHRRNLRDEQFQCIVQSGGLVGLNYYPVFLRAGGDACIDDILRHAEHFLERGGEKVLALGSDFDGADMPADLPNLEAVPKLRSEMARVFGEEVTEDIFYRNARDFFLRQQ